MNRRILLTLLFCFVCTSLKADDWSQFRGTGGLGISNSENIPLTWSDTKNIQWKLKLPGPGSSSAIINGNIVFILSYSGYGLDKKNPGDINELKRHLLAINKMNGKIIWQKEFKAEQPEDEYKGYICEHGYASSTPVTDGKNVYIFLGKSGLYAFNFDGTEIWHTLVGKQSSGYKWGSAASPILYKDLVIINAAEEARAIIAFDKNTGKIAWKLEDPQLEYSYVTPSIVQTKSSKDELIVALRKLIWGLDPLTGKKNWTFNSIMDGEVIPDAISHDGIIYQIGGRTGKASYAIKSGGKGDVTNSHLIWTSKETPYVPSPVYYNGYLFWLTDRGKTICMNAKTGEVINTMQLDIKKSGVPIYASVILIKDRLYAITRTQGAFIISADPDLILLAHNIIESDSSQFNATASVSNDQLFIRSDQYLYCISNK